MVCGVHHGTQANFAERWTTCDGAMEYDDHFDFDHSSGFIVPGVMKGDDGDGPIENPRPCAVVDPDGLCCNPGALNVGPMLHHANLTLAAARAWCKGSPACKGFTAKVNPAKSKSVQQQCADSGDQVYSVYFKSVLGGNADPLWSSWRVINNSAPRYYCRELLSLVSVCCL